MLSIIFFLSRMIPFSESDLQIRTLVDNSPNYTSLPAYFLLFCTQIDEERQRISLGMKKSYIENASGVDQSHAINGSHDHDESDSASMDNMDNELLDLLHNDDLIKHQKMLGHDNAGSEILTPTGRSASVLPLQVSLEDSDGSDLDNPVIAGQDGANENKQAAKRDRCIKKKAKDEKCVVHVLIIFRLGRLRISFWSLNSTYIAGSSKLSPLRKGVCRMTCQGQKMSLRSWLGALPIVVLSG